MWDMRRTVVVSSFPDRSTVKFTYPELTDSRKSWWLVIDGGTVDLCIVDPGYEVDLYVHSSLRSMTAVWMGISTLNEEIESGNIRVTGDPTLSRSMLAWLGLSPFATEKSRLKS